MKYELGDRVVVVCNSYASVHPGDTGTVIGIYDTTLAIKWDTFHVSRHDCDLPDVCPDGYGTFVLESDVAPLLEEDDELDGPVTQKMIEEVL